MRESAAKSPGRPGRHQGHAIVRLFVGSILLASLVPLVAATVALADAQDQPVYKLPPCSRLPAHRVKRIPDRLGNGLLGSFTLS
jgi:hypothetical protein